MSQFIEFEEKLKERMQLMQKENKLFKMDISKEDIWTKYLSSFRAEDNKIYKERSEHDCNCCKQFIRDCGSMVMIDNNYELVSIWDIEGAPEGYQIVADSMSAFVKSKQIKNEYLHIQRKLGNPFNHKQELNGNITKFDHFNFTLDNKFVNTDDREAKLGEFKSNNDVLKRSVEEISIEAIETVLELIEQGSIYRGAENKNVVERLMHIKNIHHTLDNDVKNNYLWFISSDLGGASKIRNTVIGTLLTDISNEMDLTKAVKSFEAKVAPDNYKRPTALVTKGMIEKAEKKVAELGLTDSLARRYAVSTDIKFNNVIFANRKVKKNMGVFDQLATEVKTDVKTFDNVQEVGVDIFLQDILPKAESLEVFFENKHEGNLFSLIAPSIESSKNILKWNNNFSWSYNGNMTDSAMKDRVKSAGGKVDGIIRMSLQWNDKGDNNIDFDAHCYEPNGNLIYHPKKAQTQPSSGILDVDVVNPAGKVAVENITWSDLRRMQEGKYRFIVHNYSSNRSHAGFTAEIEYEDTIYSYSYDKTLSGGEKVLVASFNFNKESGLEFIKSLPSSESQKKIWGITTQDFKPVSMIMNSPNHWDGQKIGNHHLLFVIEDCKKEGSARGLYNEFLVDDLHDDRKVFEMLGNKLKASPSTDQLSGLGFSSTKRNSVLCKVTGSFNRVIKVNF